MKEPRDAYKVLQVDPEADLEVIQAAYRRLAQKYHPDRAVVGSEPAAAALRMVEINAAWDQLREPSRRLDFDRRRSSGAAAASAGAARGTATRPAPMPQASSFTSTAGPGDSAPGSFAAETAPGRPAGPTSGSVMNFGRYNGWSLGEIARTDPGYLEWLERMPIGRPYRAELDALLRRLGRRRSEPTEAAERHGLFRRR